MRTLAALGVSTVLVILGACSSDDGTGGSPPKDSATGGGGAGTGAAPSGGTTASGGSGGSSASSGAAGEAGSGGAALTGTTVKFTVDTSKGKTPISPYIYCQSVGHASTASVDTTITRNGLKLVRAGGNRFSAYNWENNASNAGSDFVFQNDGFLSGSDTPGEALRGAMENGNQGKAAVILTGQLGDYVSADKLGGGDVRDTANYLTTRFKKNVYTKPTALTTTPDIADDSVYQDEFLNWAKSTYSKSTFLVALDNEPDIWSSTHAAIWPTKPTPAQFIQRNIDYATMLKARFPSVATLGFASYGWAGWTSFQGGYAAGNFLDFYLDELKKAETAAGKRLVDYVDLHWYPEARGVPDDVKTRVIGAGVTPAEVTARVQAPRSLWQSDYVEQSWISDSLKGSESKGAIKLLPRLKQQIAAHYPGTKLAIAEWNYGADAHISGGVATADVLGVFGRDGVDLACNWHASTDGVFRDGAFQIYGNYDGKGSRFGDTSVTATSEDVELTSVYAAVDGTDAKRLTVVLINKDTEPHVADVALTSGTAYRSGQVYVLDASAKDDFKQTAHPQAAPSVTASAPNQFAIQLKPMSVTLLVPSEEATAPTPAAWPPPSELVESGYTFDTGVEGFALDATTATALGATMVHTASEGKPVDGALEILVPFTAREQQTQISKGGLNLDLTGKKLQINIKRTGAFDGGIMIFAGSAAAGSWVSHGWTNLGSTEWTTIIFDPVAAVAKNPKFDPTAVTYLGVQFNTGAAGDVTPGTVTFHVDQIVTLGAK